MPHERPKLGEFLTGNDGKVWRVEAFIDYSPAEDFPYEVVGRHFPGPYFCLVRERATWPRFNPATGMPITRDIE